MLQLGHELLLTRELEGSADIKGDVLLSMALACCNMAAEALEMENQVCVWGYSVSACTA